MPWQKLCQPLSGGFGVLLRYFVVRYVVNDTTVLASRQGAFFGWNGAGRCRNMTNEKVIASSRTMTACSAIAFVSGAKVTRHLGWYKLACGGSVFPYFPGF